MGSHPANLAVRWNCPLWSPWDAGVGGKARAQRAMSSQRSCLLPLQLCGGSSPCPAIRAGPDPRWLRYLARSASDLRQHSLHLPSGGYTRWEASLLLAPWPLHSRFTMLSPTIVSHGCCVPNLETSG
jgi:hypothetical protein